MTSPVQERLGPAPPSLPSRAASSANHCESANCRQTSSKRSRIMAFGASVSRRTLTRNSPWAVNLTTLPRRLMRIRPSRRGSGAGPLGHGLLPRQQRKDEQRSGKAGQEHGHLCLTGKGGVTIHLPAVQVPAAAVGFPLQQIERASHVQERGEELVEITTSRHGHRKQGKKGRGRQGGRFSVVEGRFLPVAAKKPCHWQGSVMQLLRCFVHARQGER